MERFFISRPSAIALIARARKKLLADAGECVPSEAQPLLDRAAQLERLLLDVRACRIDAFELTDPTPVHITISAD
ncbi:hypothetical protein [Paraburkholderia acidipaludis]|uniref:hypothetical protein n=1 Tax=Paraburkholderia acidipaludis TaxID=660537 RepID=UPI000482E50C|nr:hypothetical protein [Paraburkholderia acidipaludis]